MIGPEAENFFRSTPKLLKIGFSAKSSSELAVMRFTGPRTHPLAWRLKRRVAMPRRKRVLCVSVVNPFPSVDSYSGMSDFCAPFQVPQHPQILRVRLLCNHQICGGFQVPSG